MSIEELQEKPLEELEALSDEELKKFFAPYFKYTIPTKEQKEQPSKDKDMKTIKDKYYKPSSPPKVSSKKSDMDLLERKMAQLGIKF